MSDAARLTRVHVETELGPFALGVDEENAPLGAAHFLAYVDGGWLDGSSVYRIVTLANQPPEKEPKIEVIQWGWQPARDGEPPPVPHVRHEPTSVTGLRHLDGTLSTARFAPGTGYGFFICIGDQPELDDGGRRHPDGAGFAAFGRVLEGEDTVRRIFARAEEAERPRDPVRVLSARRAAGPA